jgi:uracil-DNA glycosylase
MVDNDWSEILNIEFQKQYYKELDKFIRNEYKTKTIFPIKEEIFNAFEMCSFSNTKVIVLGQDPYHNINQAHGLAFSVVRGNKFLRH